MHGPFQDLEQELQIIMQGSTTLPEMTHAGTFFQGDRLKKETQRSKFPISRFPPLDMFNQLHCLYFAMRSGRLLPVGAALLKARKLDIY